MNELELEKMKIVWAFNALQEQINSFWDIDIAWESWPLKDLIRRRDILEEKIKRINEKLKDLDSKK